MTSEGFLERFGHFVDAPGGMQRLRELTLQLAVHGKLTSPDPKDTPTASLINQIRIAKGQAITEKRIRQKEYETIQPTEIPYPAPKHWAWVRLGELGELCGGGTPSKSKSQYWDGEIPWVSPKDMKGGRVTSAEMSITQIALEETSVRFIPRNSILVVARSGILKRTLPVCINEIDCTVNQDIKVIIPWIPQLTDYLQLMLRGNERFILNHLVKGGMTVQSLKYAEFELQPFPLPPLAEQHRIVAKVNELMALCDRLETERNARNATHTRLIRAVHHPLTAAGDAASTATAWRRIRDNFADLYTTRESVQALRQTILQLAVQGKLVPQDSGYQSAAIDLARIRKRKGDLIRSGAIKKQKAIPVLADAGMQQLQLDGWVWGLFDDLVEVVGGVTKGRKLQGKETASFPYLRVANVQRGQLDLSTLKEIEIRKDELERYRLLPGDLLVTEGGDWDKVGRTAIWSGEVENCLHQNHVFRARLFHSMTDKYYLMLYLNSPVSRDYFASSSKQTTNLASINMTQLRSAPIPLPPLAEQHRIVAKVDELMALCDRLEAAIKSRDDTASRYAEAVVQQMSAA